MRHVTRIATPVLLLASILLLGCGEGEAHSQHNSGTTPPAVTLPAVYIPPPADDLPGPATSDHAIAHEANVFAFDLYRQLAATKGNLFFSPSSIHTALAMTYAGARGQTAEQMARTLHYPLDGDSLHPAYAELLKTLSGVPKEGFRPPAYQLYIANALWGQEGFTFEPAFLAINEASYGAGVNTVDFKGDTDASRETINRWVENATNNKIKDLLAEGSVSADTRLVLTNAIYFKADWAEQFVKERTKDGDFHTSNGSTVKVPMMRDVKHGRMLRTDTFQAATLPYRGGELSMTIFLPNDRDGLAAMEQQLTPNNLGRWQEQFEHARIDWTLPRWTFTSSFDLAGTLAAMGMPEAFSNDADFTGMSTSEHLQISAVVHQAFVAVDETGTEAAAATAVGVSATSFPTDVPVPFVVDHPFVFMIRHDKTGSILFMGRVENPKK